MGKVGNTGCKKPNLFQTRQIVDRIEFFFSRLANIPERKSFWRYDF